MGLIICKFCTGLFYVGRILIYLIVNVGQSVFSLGFKKSEKE